MSALMKTVGPKHTIMIGLFFEMLQLMWYGFGSQQWMMWSAGILAAVSSISYPAISAYVSMHADADKQGLVQGMITGIRGLCNGLGPAMFGLIFYIFHVDLNENNQNAQEETNSAITFLSALMPGPPFVFGALLVLLAIMMAAMIPEQSSIVIMFDEEGSKQPRYKDDLIKHKKDVAMGKLSDESLDSDTDSEYSAPLIKSQDNII
jgi:MFS family permease